MPNPIQIETPLFSGATDFPNAPQTKGISPTEDPNVARNELTARVAGYEVQHQTQPTSWSRIAKGFDPNMPAEAYDQARKKYFNEVIAPRLGQNEDRFASWKYFKSKTERPSISPTERKVLAVDLAATGLVHALSQPLGSLDSLIRSQRPSWAKEKGAFTAFNEMVEDTQKKLIQKARREGVSNIPTYVGEIAGAVAPFSATTKIAKAGLEAASLAKIPVVSKLVEGGVSFGLFEAATANEGDRYTAGVKGFATGVAFEGALGLAGKLFKRGVSREQVDKIVTNVLSGEGKPDLELDDVLANEIKKDVQASRAEGRPQFIKEDPKAKGVSVLLHDSENRAATIKVMPGMERAAVKDILNITRRGGAVDGIIHNPNAVEMLQRFMRVSADEGAERYEGVRILKTAEDQAPTIALEHELDGKATQAVSPNEVAVQDTQRAVPHRSEIEAGVAQLKDEEGYPLTKGARDFVRADVEKLWDPNVPDARKEVSAERLRNWELKDLIPEQWRREKIVNEDALDHVVGAEASEAEINRLQEIAEKEPQRAGRQRWEPGLGEELQSEAERGGTAEGAARDTELFQQAKRELPNATLSEQLRRAQELKVKATEELHIPESETYILQEGEEGPEKVSIGETPRRIALKVSATEMRDLLPGAKAVMGHPGAIPQILERLGYPEDTLKQIEAQIKEPKPIIVYQEHPSKMTTFHEGLHVDRYHTPGALSIMRGEGNTAADSIANGLREHRVYKDLDEGKMREEAFVHAATAIRTGDANALQKLVRYDGSVGEVFAMVNDRAVRLLEAARANVDSAPSRVLQRKMEHLDLLTTTDRAYGLIDRTTQLLKDWSYDPESKMWKLKSLDTLAEETYDSYRGMVGKLMAQNGEEWAPSHTLFAEARGVRGPIVPRGSGPVKNPLAVDTPPDVKWGGFAAIQGWYRPMGPWVADLDTRVNNALSKFGKRLPIHARFKDVDDAFRAGQQWLDDNYEEARQLLKGVDSKKQYAYFNVLTTDPKHWSGMVKQMGLEDTDLTRITDIDKWLGKFRDDTGILVKNYLRDELPRLKGRGYTLEAVYGNLRKTPSQMSTFERLITSGKLDPKAQHIGSFMDTMLREGFSKKYTDKPLKELEKLTELKAKNGGYVLGNMRHPLVNYTRYMRGVPDTTSQIMTKTVNQFMGALGEKTKQLNKHLPSYAQLPEEFSYPKALINKMMVWSYASALGLRAAIPIRDTLQVLSTGLPILGPERFLRGMTKGLTKEGLEFAEEQGALLRKRTVGDLVGDISGEIPVNASNDFVTNIANKLLAPSRWGHNAARLVMFHGEYHSALEGVKLFREGKITFDELSGRKYTSLWWNDKPLLDRIKGQLGDPGFSNHEVARNISLETLDLTMWPYRRGTQPALLRTGAGRIFGQFGMWPLNYRDFLIRGASKFKSHPREALYTTALWAGANYAAVSSMNSMGADTGKWFWFSPSAVDMSPHAAFIKDLAESPKDSQEGREARRRVLEYPLNFFPSGIELRNIGKAYDSGEDFFNDDGTLTPSALRVLGFAPHKEMPERDVEDEIKYQMGYSERKHQ